MRMFPKLHRQCVVAYGWKRRLCEDSQTCSQRSCSCSQTHQSISLACAALPPPQHKTSDTPKIQVALLCWGTWLRMATAKISSKAKQSQTEINALGPKLWNRRRSLRKPGKTETKRHNATLLKPREPLRHGPTWQFQLPQNQFTISHHRTSFTSCSEFSWLYIS